MATLRLMSRESFENVVLSCIKNLTIEHHFAMFELREIYWRGLSVVSELYIMCKWGVEE